MRYTYRCNSCEHVFDAEFPFTRNPETVECPECQGEAERAISLVSVVYLGGGWSTKGQRHSDGKYEPTPEVAALPGS